MWEVRWFPRERESNFHRGWLLLLFNVHYEKSSVHLSTDKSLHFFKMRTKFKININLCKFVGNGYPISLRIVYIYYSVLVELPYWIRRKITNFLLSPVHGNTVEIQIVFLILSVRINWFWKLNEWVSNGLNNQKN